MKCPKCEAKIDEEDEFCPNCDFKIKKRGFKNIHLGFAIISALLILFLVLAINLHNKNTELKNQNTELNNNIINLENEITKLNKREERLNEEIKEKEEIINKNTEEISNLNAKINQLSAQKTKIKYQCSDGTIKETLADCSKSVETVAQETTMSGTEFWNVFCDVDATNLQKQRTFEKYEGSYITATGEVSVVHTDGEVYLKHCKSTWTWDIEVKMQSSQIDKLVPYKEGDELTYKSRITTFNPNVILGAELKADSGTVVS